MAIAGQSASRHDAVGAVLQCLEDHQDIQLAGAGQLDDLDRRRVLETEPSGEVGGGIGTMLTAVGNNL